MITQAWWRLVRFGFRLLYHEMAFTYDAVSWVVSMGAWRCWQRTTLKHLPAPSAGRVLEVAHGTGNLHIDLHAAGYDAIGYDLSPQMGAITRRKLHTAGVPARLARGMAQQLPFADASFAAVVSTFPTDFIVQAATLREFQRVLQPGGCAVIVPNGVFTGSGVVQSALEGLYRITGQREDSQLNAQQLFTGYGFTVEGYEETCPRSLAQVIVLRK